MEDNLAEIERRLDRLERDRGRKHNQLEGNREDQATILQNDEVLDGLQEEEARKAAGIRAALERISEGKYGICRGCRSKIPSARLKALPEATLCVTCADAREHGP